MLQALDKVTGLVVAIVGFSLLGVWADKKFATDPYLTVLGVIVGTIIGFWLFLAKLKNKNTKS